MPSLNAGEEFLLPFCDLKSEVIFDKDIKMKPYLALFLFLSAISFPTLSYSYCTADGNILDTDLEGTLYVTGDKHGMLYIEDIDGDFYVDILNIHTFKDGSIEIELETEDYMRKDKHKIFYFEMDKENADKCF